MKKTKLLSHTDVLNYILDLKKITIAQLSDMTGIPRTTLYALQHGTTLTAKKKTQQLICQVLDLPMEIWDLKADNLNIEYELLKEHMKFHNVTYSDISNSLKALGYKFSPENIQEIIEKGLLKKMGLQELVMTIITFRFVITPEEFRIVSSLRKLRYKQLKTILDLIEEIIRLLSLDSDNDKRQWHLNTKDDGCGYFVPIIDAEEKLKFEDFDLETEE